MASLLRALEGNATDCAASIFATDIIQERLGSFLTTNMALRNAESFAASFGVDGK